MNLKLLDLLIGVDKNPKSQPDKSSVSHSGFCDLYEHNTLKSYVCLNFMINITTLTNQRIL